MWRAYSSTIILLIAVFLSCCPAGNDAEKITFVNATTSRLRILAVFGHPGKSHFDVFLPLLEELARRGHHVTVISHFPRTESAKAREPLPTYKDISLRNPDIGIYINVIDLQYIKHSYYNLFINLFTLQHMANIACKSALLHNLAIKEFIKSNEQFDVMLTESFNTDCFLGFAYRFQVPYLRLSSHQIMPWANVDMGNVDNPSYMMTVFNGYDQPMNFFNRMSNTLSLLFSKLAYEYWFRPIDQAIANEAFGPDLPKLKTLVQESKALLLNTHFSLYGNRPQLLNVIEVSGLHIASKNLSSLPNDIAEFLDNAHDGVLYFNLGSMIKLSTMPAKKMDAILNVISSIPHKVIWKWENDQLPRAMSNVMARKWLPQFDVLSK
jgi:glucuronosyltransferase